MPFDKGFEIFLSWQTLLLCLGIFLITFGIRRVVETGWVKAKKNKWWNEVVLPMKPIVVGALFGRFMLSFPWPTAVAGNKWAQVFYGAFCGLISGWVYGRLRAIMRTWVGNKVAGADPMAPLEAKVADPKTEDPLSPTSKDVPPTP